MKHSALIVLFFLSTKICFSQIPLNKDSLVKEICYTIETEFTNDEDSIRILKSLGKHLTPYILKIPKDSIVSFIDPFYIRLQRECPSFIAAVSGLAESKKGDWEVLNVEPESQLSEKDFGIFFKQNNLKYLEPNGDTVILSVSDSTWTDNFKDGTKSNLSLVRLAKNEFVITFISSNNYIRSNFSKVGDKYRYKILQKTDKYYLVFTQPVGTNSLAQFKIYY